MFKKPILKPFALCGTASILVILKHATDPADPLREVIGFFFDEAVCELCYGHLDVFPKLDVVASLLRDVLEHSRWRDAHHLGYLLL